MIIYNVSVLLLSRKVLVLVLVLGLQVCLFPCPRTLSPCDHHWYDDDVYDVWSYWYNAVLLMSRVAVCPVNTFVKIIHRFFE